MSFATTKSVYKTIENCHNGCVACFYQLVEEGNKLYLKPDYSNISDSVRVELNPDEDKTLIYDADTGMFHQPTFTTDVAAGNVICVMGEPTLVPWEAGNSNKCYELSKSIDVILEMYKAKRDLISAIQVYNEGTWRI